VKILDKLKLPFKKSPNQIQILKDQVTQLQDQLSSFPSQSMHGGYHNALTGAGSSLDKTAYSFFVPTNIISKYDLEVLYNESWAAASFVDIPVDDMFVRWREFTDMETANQERMQEVELEFKITEKLSSGMKAARLYGTGLVCMISKEAPLNLPLAIDRIQPGDLLNIMTFDRFDATVVSRNNNFGSKKYGQPEIYRITLMNGGAFEIHASRVIRFDGKIPLTQNGFSVYDKDWGVPSIVPVIIEIMQDSAVSKGVAHLVNEASVVHQKIEDFADAISGGGDCEMSIEERMSATTMLRSIYRTNYMDKEDDAMRLEVNFSNLPEIMDRNSRRVAAAAKIPLTRFMGTSPIGLNSTGDGDMQNHAIQIKADQENKLAPELILFDKFLAKHAGINETVQYEFPSLIDISDADQATILATKIGALATGTNTDLIDEMEARKALDGDPVLGNLDLEKERELLPEIEEFMKRNQVVGP